MTRIEHDFITVEWDDNKNKINKQKHKVSFETAQLVFFDENCLTKTDFVKDGEQRWRSIGKVAENVILFVGHLYYDDNDKEVFRIITARKATSHEEREYYDNY